MLTGRIGVSASVGGLGVSSTITREAEGQIGQEPLLPAAKVGSLTTRTDDDEGSLTLSSSHGIETADIIDIYWDGGRRYNVVVGTVAGNVVPFSGGAGDNLPSEDTAVTVSKQKSIDMDVDGDLISMIVASCEKVAHLGFYEDSTLKLSVDVPATEFWAWWSSGATSNPLAGVTITEVRASQGDTSAQTLRLGLLYDSA